MFRWCIDAAIAAVALASLGWLIVWLLGAPLADDLDWGRLFFVVWFLGLGGGIAWDLAATMNKIDALHAQLVSEAE